MERTDRIIGFYRWDGDPCRLLEDTEAVGGVRAEIYIGGVGFQPINAADVLLGAVPVSEEEFRELVLEEIALGKAGSA